MKTSNIIIAAAIMAMCLGCGSGQNAAPDPSAKTEFDTPPTPVGPSPFPQYPPEAVSRHISGRVVAQVFVTQNGEVTNPKVVSEEPAGAGFSSAVLAVLPQWRFHPATAKGKAVGVWVTIPFKFKISESGETSVAPEMVENTPAGR